MESGMLVGAAEMAITPPLGTELAGYFETRVADGVISDLYAKAVVAGSGDDRIALVACDLVTMTAEITAAVRRTVTARTGIAGERVLVCSTHTHTGPEVRSGRIVARNEEYVAALPDLIAAAVIRAACAQRPCAMFVGSAPEEGLAFNRRFRCRDSSEQFGVAGAAGHVLGAAGPIDPEFGVIKFAENATAAPFALICFYTLHIDVTGGTMISADYPAVMTEVLRGVYGPDTVVLFVQGAAGNINHVPYQLDRPWPRKGVEKSRQIGRALAGKALCTAEKALPSTDVGVDVLSEILTVPRYPRDEVLARRVAAARAKEKPSFFDERLLQLVDEYDDSGTDPREVQVLRLGDVAICSAPGELFVEWGLEIKKWSPFPFTFIAELANDSVGYIPTFEAFGRGGYEATPVVSVRSTPALGQMVADADIRLCHRLAERQRNMLLP